MRPRPPAWAGATVLVVTAALAAGCDGSEGDLPAALLDGSPAVAAEVAFEGVDVPVVLTAVERVAPGRADERRDTCLESLGDRATSSPAVVRVGAESESVTVRDAPGRAVRGCDNSAGGRERNGRWCGSAYGRLDDGQLVDPRLDLLCTTEDGEPLGFVWLEPDPRARFVIVAHRDYAEAYETTGENPVRIAFRTGVDLGRFAASVEVSEHDASGTLVRRHVVDARVAG